MNYRLSRQNETLFAKNVFPAFTEVVGGDPNELSKLLHDSFRVDDFAYSDDFMYFGMVEYFKKTVIPHKIAVYNAGMKLLENPLIDKELYTQGKEDFKFNLWVHDLSKFSADESFGYSQYDFKTKTGKPQFEKAWHHHKVHNPHHPEYWLNPNRSGELEPIDMPNIYVLEMIADWMGAGETYGTPLEEWAKTNLPKFKFANLQKVSELISDFTGIPVKISTHLTLIPQP